MDHRILSSADGAVGTLTFNYPERHNALSLDMWRASAEALEGFVRDPAIRVVILTGAGGKAFVSGADIAKFEDERANAVNIASYNEAVAGFYSVLMNCPKPTIAMIRGYCIGGGVGIAVCCDMRICNETSRFAVPAAKLGVGYGFEDIRRLMDLVGPQFVSEILITARQFDAQEALRMGLVNKVVADSEIESYVSDLAETIARNAPLTIQAVKTIVRELLNDPVDRNIGACDLLVTKCFESADYQEGRRAFLEKRKPVFTGR